MAMTMPMKKYECGKCGYIYDEAVGDSAGGIKAGTMFEDLPDSWVCPKCKASIDEFFDSDGGKMMAD